MVTYNKCCYLKLHQDITYNKFCYFKLHIKTPQLLKNTTTRHHDDGILSFFWIREEEQVFGRLGEWIHVLVVGVTPEGHHFLNQQLSFPLGTFLPSLVNFALVLVHESTILKQETLHLKCEFLLLVLEWAVHPSATAEDSLLVGIAIREWQNAGGNNIYEWE